MATSPIPSHPRPVETVPHHSRRSGDASAPVLLTTMATTLLIAIVVIVLTATHTAGVPKVAQAMLAMA